MKDRIERCALHIPVGAFNAWLISDEKVAGVLFCNMFIIYELNEDWHIKDNAWKDIFGWLCGFAGYFIVKAIFKRDE